MRVCMSFLHGRHTLPCFLPRPSPHFPSHYTSQGADNAPDGHGAPECVEYVSLNLSSPVGTPSCYVGRRDLNRYMSLCGFSRSNASRVLTLDLTSVIPFSTRPLRLHLDISGGGGPVLVTAENTTMGDLHIRRQPLSWHFWTYPHHLLLLFCSLAGFNGGPTRLEVRPIA